MIFWIESGMVLMAVALAFAFPHLGSRWFEAGERALGKLAERPRLAVLVVGLTALAARAALLPILPIPEPSVHDEFSYLLAADTFAHGRLTNPTHPMWIHFETFHELWQPTYASMFPPGQGLILAFGQVVLGHPFWGVWLSLGLMCGAICWMLQAWLPARWALLGGLLAVIRLATFSYWANSYWGGAVAATGGALVFGALPRLKRSLRVRDALLLALGLAILANSRPYEGLVFSLPVGAALLVWMLGKNRPPVRALPSSAWFLPAGLLLGLVAAFMGYYSWRVTGNPWRTPHEAYSETHLVTPYFLWQTPGPVPTYRHAVMKDFYLTFELATWAKTRSLAGLTRWEFMKAFEVWTFYLYPLFTLPILLAMAVQPYGFSWRQIAPGTRFLLMATGFGLTGYAVEVYLNPHYTAPGTCLFFALVLVAMRSVRNWRWRQKPVGVALTRAIPLIAVALVLCAAWGPSLWPREGSPSAWCSPWGARLMLDRARMLRKLEQEPGRHLVIVKYSTGHSPLREWVYNRADIDASKVVWARDMGPEQNEELLRYFHDRRIWLVEPDLTPPRLSVW